MAERESDKNHSLDEIIDHMTADLQSYDGQYLLLPPTRTKSTHQWNTSSNSITGNTVHSPGLFYSPSQTPDKSEMIGMGMVDVGGGNYVNVVLSKPNIPQATVVPPTMGNYLHYQQSSLLNHHYYTPRSYSSEPQPRNNCILENLVGNWNNPQSSGTYSPFGNSGIMLTNVTEVLNGVKQQQQQHEKTNNPQLIQPIAKKQRIVAEVKPMRPSYSDVLAKSSTNLQQRNCNSIKETNVKNNQPSTSPSASSIHKQFSVGNTNLKDDCIGNNHSSKNKIKSGDNLFKKSDVKNWHTSDDRKASIDDGKKEKKKKNKPDKDDVGTKTKGSQHIDINPDDFENVILQNNYKNSNNQNRHSPILSERSSMNKPKNKNDDKKSSLPNTSSTSILYKSDRFNSSMKIGLKSKRNPRSLKKRQHYFGRIFKLIKEKFSHYLFVFTSWFINLIWDVTSMSSTILAHMVSVLIEKCFSIVCNAKKSIFSTMSNLNWFSWSSNSSNNRGGKSSKSKRNLNYDDKQNGVPSVGLQHNIPLPTTGIDAMKRLLSCKGKDPYSILGVTNICSDDEIKRYYKSQALLVHPDKNSQPGAEEAFKILRHAFELVCEPEKRASYDRHVAEANRMEEACSVLSDLINQFHEKMEYAATTLRCTKCNKRHKREVTERYCYAARFCAQCKINHSAKEGDMWCESGEKWWHRRRYFAVMEGKVYDITPWARCQAGSLSGLIPDSHEVTYRVLLGSRSGNYGSKKKQYDQDTNTGSTTVDDNDSDRSNRRSTDHGQQTDNDLEELLNSFYGSHPGCNGHKKGSKKKRKHK